MTRFNMKSTASAAALVMLATGCTQEAPKLVTLAPSPYSIGLKPPPVIVQIAPADQQPLKDGIARVTNETDGHGLITIKEGHHTHSGGNGNNFDDLWKRTGYALAEAKSKTVQIGFHGASEEVFWVTFNEVAGQDARRRFICVVEQVKPETVDVQ